MPFIPIMHGKVGWMIYDDILLHFTTSKMAICYTDIRACPCRTRAAEQ